MSSREQKKMEAALERVLGPGLGEGERSPGTGSIDHDLDRALSKRLDALRDGAGLSEDQKKIAWENIMERRAEAPPLGAPDMSSLPEKGQTSIFQRPILMVTAAAASIFLAFGIYSIYQRDVGPAGIPGRIVETAGDVRINDRPAKKGDIVRAGDRIRAGEKSHYIMVVDGKSAFRGSAKSELVYRIGPERADLDIKSGYLAAYIGKRKIDNRKAGNDKAGNRRGMGPWRISTPHATAVIKGTTIFMGMPSKTRTYFCICNGRVHVEPRKTPGGAKPHPMAAKHHRSAVFDSEPGTNGGPGMIKERKSGMLLHKDPMLERLAELVGGKIDWNRIDKDAPPAQRNHAPPGP